MADFPRELFVQSLEQWRRYPVRFSELPTRVQSEFLQEQGYITLRELLTHVAAWWEEAVGIIADTLRHGDKGAREYDLDAFNAAALERYKGMAEADFSKWYESQLEQISSVLTDLTEQELGIKRVRNWLNAVILEHLKEHGFDVPRFLVTDMLQREWAGYQGDYASLAPAAQTEFLRKQGFDRYPDVLAHILAWWEQGIEVIQRGSTEDPCDVVDVDAFNAQAVARFSDTDESGVAGRFEETRLTLAHLVDTLPDELIMRPNIQGWLRADVLQHYYEHAV